MSAAIHRLLPLTAAAVFGCGLFDSSPDNQPLPEAPSISAHVTHLGEIEVEFVHDDADRFRMYWSESPSLDPANGTRVSNVQSPFIFDAAQDDVTYYFMVEAIAAGAANTPSAVASVRRSADIDVSQSWQVGSEVRSTWDIVVVIQSTFEVARVDITIGTDVTPLAQRNTSNNWTATLDLSAYPRGPLTAVFEAEDVMGNVTRETVGRILDDPPVLEVRAPTRWSVVRSELAIDIACMDDNPDGCTDLRITGGGIPGSRNANRFLIAQGTDAIQTTATIGPEWDDREMHIRIRGVDSRGQRTESVFDIPTLMTSALHEVTTVPGRIVDMDETRVLYRTTEYDPGEYRIKHIASGADSSVTNGFLFASGLVTDAVMFVESFTLHQWKAGVTTTVLPVAAATDWVGARRFAGPYTAYRERGSGALFRYDASTGNNVRVADGARASPTVTANGTVYFQAPESYGQLLRYTNAGTDTLTTDAGASPVADDHYVVFRSYAPGVESSFVARDPGGNEIVLAGPADIRQRVGELYATTNGWIAYSDLVAGSQQIWLYSPAGADERVTFFSATAGVEALAGNGRLVVALHEEYTFPRYLVETGSTPVPLGQRWSGSFVKALGADLYYAIGGTLFRVE